MKKIKGILVLSIVLMTFSVNAQFKFGVAFFFFLPLAIGGSSGILPEPKKAALGTLLSLLVFSVFLIFTKIEGLVCVLMVMIVH